jgi:uncharacterized membrane protein YeaQ/YmgE (transglycosylase-associated protein family)
MNTLVHLAAAAVIGGLVGMLAEKVSGSGISLLKSIVLGVIGGVLAGIVARFLGVPLTGLLGYVIASLVGSVALVSMGRAIRS